MIRASLESKCGCGTEERPFGNTSKAIVTGVREAGSEAKLLPQIRASGCKSGAWSEGTETHTAAACFRPPAGVGVAASAATATGTGTSDKVSFSLASGAAKSMERPARAKKIKKNSNELG